MAEAQAVNVDIDIRDGAVVLKLSSTGVPEVPIALSPQIAFELGEKLARAAHQARYGEPIQTDESYLAQQIRQRTTEQYRAFLIRRIEIMLNSMRENKVFTNVKLAQELVDTVLTKLT